MSICYTYSSLRVLLQNTKIYDGQTWKEIGHSLTDLLPIVHFEFDHLRTALRCQQSDGDSLILRSVRHQVKEKEASASSSKTQKAPMLLIDGVRCEKLSTKTTLAINPSTQDC